MVKLDGSFEGILCPTVSLFNNGTVDEESLSRVTEFILNRGVDGLFPCGSTGEFASLTPEDRYRVIETVSENAGDAPVIAGAAGTSVPETLARIEDANEAGADAAAIVAPYFHSANQPEGTRQFFQAIADQATLPLFLYNIPMHVGTGITTETVAALAEHDSVRGMKDSSGDFSYFLAVDRKTPDEFLLFQGFDTLLVPALRADTNGGIHALANAIPEVFAEVIKHADDHGGAHLQQNAIAPLLELCLEYGVAPTVKAALVHRDVIPTDEVKPPLVPLAEGKKVEIGSGVDHALSLANE
jgi:4-hydroxy-tetrahydrodipicolinate synthase